MFQVVAEAAARVAEAPLNNASAQQPLSPKSLNIAQASGIKNAYFISPEMAARMKTLAES